MFARFEEMQRVDSLAVMFVMTRRVRRCVIRRCAPRLATMLARSSSFARRLRYGSRYGT